MLAGLLLGMLWFLVFLAGHLGVLALRPVRRRFAFIVQVFAAAAAALVASCLLAAGGSAALGGGFACGTAVNAAAGLLVMLCLFVVYMPFLFVIGTSLSVQSLVLLSQRPAGVLPLRTLSEAFVSKELVGARLETMVLNGYLRRRGSAYVLTPRGRAVAGAFASLKRLWRLGAGG